MDFLTNTSANEELLQQLHDTQERLRQTELQLCEKDIENIHLKIKYLSYQRNAEERDAQNQYHLNLVLNSKTWKLRNYALAPLIKYKTKCAAREALSAYEEPNQINYVEPVALSELPDDNSWENRLMKTPRIAIQVHAFYPDLIKDICEYLTNLPFKYDLYITTTEGYKATYLEEYLNHHSGAENFYIELVENKGRDVIPFLKQMQPVLSKYDYICHLHTKRSLHHAMGKLWRIYLYDNLLGNSTQVKKIISEFEHNPKMGVIFPDIPEFLKNLMNWGTNREYAQQLMEAMGADPDLLPDDIFFPAGTMFWARTAAVKNLFDIDFSVVNVPEETGQIDGTIMHAIERLWLFIAEMNGYTYRMYPNISEIKDIVP